MRFPWTPPTRFQVFPRKPRRAEARRSGSSLSQLHPTHSIPDHLLIDVADYEHVPNGPGTVLVSHEANIHLDLADGRPGLLYIRKQPLKGDLRERIRALSATRWKSPLASSSRRWPAA